MREWGAAAVKPFFLERMSRARFLKTGNNDELACNATFDVLAASGMVCFYAWLCRKGPVWWFQTVLLFLAARTQSSGLLPLPAGATVRKGREAKGESVQASEAEVADRSEETQDFDPGQVNRFCHAHTLCRLLDLQNVGEAGCTLKGLTWCFPKNGGNFAAGKHKTYFDGRHTFLPNLLIFFHRNCCAIDGLSFSKAHFLRWGQRSSSLNFYILNSG